MFNHDLVANASLGRICPKSAGYLGKLNTSESERTEIYAMLVGKLLDQTVFAQILLRVVLHIVIKSGIVRQRACIPRSDGEKGVAHVMTTWRLSLTELAPISMNLVITGNELSWVMLL